MRKFLGISLAGLALAVHTGCSSPFPRQTFLIYPVPAEDVPSPEESKYHDTTILYRGDFWELCEDSKPRDPEPTAIASSDSKYMARHVP